MKKLIAAGAAGAAAALAGVVAARTLAFKPRAEERPAPDAAGVDEKKVVDDLAAMIRCRTVSNLDHSLEDEAEFEKFRALLRERFPLLHERCAPERIGRCGLLFTWKGRTSETPSVLMAHYDVVPADEANWSRPPFDGVIEDGVLWGRGTLDTKSTLCCALEAAEQLLGEGFTPAHDLYFAFSGEEEIAGDSAADIVDELQRRGVVPAFVLDEGGAVVSGVFPGVDAPCALVGTSEKGQMQLFLDMKSEGGHASAPPRSTIVGKLAKAVTPIEKRPAPFTLTPPAAEMFDTLGRRSTLPVRMVFANLWLFRVNLRIMCGDSADKAEERIRRTIKNDAISLRRGPWAEPSPYSETEGSEGWARLKSAIQRTWPDAIVSPYLMLAGSDSRHYGRISRNVYRFGPMELSKEERGTIHGNNERVPICKVVKCAEFYLRLIRSC